MFLLGNRSWCGGWFTSFRCFTHDSKTMTDVSSVYQSHICIWWVIDKKHSQSSSIIGINNHLTEWVKMYSSLLIHNGHIPRWSPMRWPSPMKFRWTRIRLPMMCRRSETMRKWTMWRRKYWLVMIPSLSSERNTAREGVTVNPHYYSDYAMERVHFNDRYVRLSRRNPSECVVRYDGTIGIHPSLSIPYLHSSCSSRLHRSRSSSSFSCWRTNVDCGWTSWWATEEQWREQW